MVICMMIQLYTALWCITDAVFVLDTGFHVFVWVGKEATSHEKGGGLIIAHVSLNSQQKTQLLFISSKKCV